MEDLDDEERAELQRDLRALVAELRATIDAAREGSRPVDLDQPIGRVSRVDAIQQQRMVEAGRAAAQRRLAQAEGALRRLDDRNGADYGECSACGEPIGYSRLKAPPEAPFCIACQSLRESGDR